MISFHGVLAQNSWQEYTKNADFLEQELQFEAAYNLRQKAFKAAKINQKDTLPFLELLMDISKNEVILPNQNKTNEVYSNLKNQIVTLTKFNATPERLFRIYNRLYKFANEINNIEDSGVFITKALEYQYKSKIIDSLSLLKTLQNAGTTYRKSGELNKSVEMFQEAEKICLNLNIEDASLLGFNYLSLSELYRYRYLDNPKNYIKYLKKAQVVYESANAIDDMIHVYFGLSDFLSNRGDFKQSINYLKKAFQVYKDDVQNAKKQNINKRNIEKEIKFHNYFIEKYRTISNEELMLYHLNEILKLAAPEVLNDNIKDLISLSHIYLVEYYENLDDDKALVYLNKGSQFFPTKDLYFIREEYDMHYAKIFINNHEYDKAEVIIKELSNKKNLPMFIAKTILEKRIILNTKLGLYDEACAEINNLLIRYFDAEKDVDINTIAYKDFKPGTVLSDTQRFLNLAQEFKIASKENVAETLYWLALKQFQTNLNHEILNDRINTLYSDICYYFYSKASKGKLDTKKLNQFIMFTETIESKHLLNTFINNRVESKTFEIDSLINEEQLIRNQITALKRQNIEKQSDSINQLVFEENLKLEKINEQLKTNSNMMASLVNVDHVLQNTDNYIIKYKLVNNSLFVIEFNKAKSIIVSEIKDYGKLKTKVEETAALLKTPGSAKESINRNTAFLFDKLLGNTNILKSISTVYIIPDGVLHYLPFELLIHNNHYLLQNTTISYASALSFINNSFGNQKLERKQNIALFAPSYTAFAPSDAQLAVRGEPYYLEGALKEVKSISKLFSNSDLFINEKASKDAFRNVSNNYSILHLSMHSYLNDEDSELSSLVFSDNEADHELYISELYGLNLNADMAVLSACNTGVGELKTGNGIISMNTAFTSAGVPSVLSSLWSAPDDATQKIMTAFYGYLKAGNPKNIALKKAKIDYLESTKDSNLKHPYYWAGFVLTGDVSPIVISTNYWVYALVALGLLAIYLLVRTRRLKSKL
jgi:CHAT domain-containing protein/tetratricopeptide (TPR) repeat protein